MKDSISWHLCTTRYCTKRQTNRVWKALEGAGSLTALSALETSELNVQSGIDQAVKWFLGLVRSFLLSLWKTHEKLLRNTPSWDSHFFTSCFVSFMGFQNSEIYPKGHCIIFLNVLESRFWKIYRKEGRRRRKKKTMKWMKPGERKRLHIAWRYLLLPLRRERKTYEPVQWPWRSEGFVAWDELQQLFSSESQRGVKNARFSLQLLLRFSKVPDEEGLQSKHSSSWSQHRFSVLSFPHDIVF